MATKKKKMVNPRTFYMISKGQWDCEYVAFETIPELLEWINEELGPDEVTDTTVIVVEEKELKSLSYEWMIKEDEEV